MTRRQQFNYAVKASLAYALYYSGLLHLYQRLVMRRKAVVLMYHRVLTPEEKQRTASHPAIVVDRETFEMQMRVLKRHFAVLDVAQFADRLERKEALPDCACVITFDDGWRDNFTNALPILERHGLPALVFLPVNYIGSDRLFWQEALVHLLVRVPSEARRDSGQRDRLVGLLEPHGLGQVVDLPADADPRPTLFPLVDAQKRLTRAEIESLVRRLSSALGVRVEQIGALDGFMDWQQVAAMARRGIAFGGHGVEHLLLTHVSAEEADGEIRGAKEMLDQRFTGTVPTFSYPNGYCSDDLVRKVARFGYALAFITRRGFVSCDDDPMTVRRLNIHEGVTKNPPMFMARLVGLL